MNIREYIERLRNVQKAADLTFVGTYLASSVTDALCTLTNIRHYTEESNAFVSFMMEKYGICEGLLRIQGIEALQFAALLGISHTTVELWKWLRGESIDMEVRCAVVYVYSMVGVTKHIQGILSWL